jgi:hypothetical protein
MHYKHLMMISGVLLLLTSLTAQAQSQVRGSGKPSAEVCPDQRTYTGKYRNQYYGFSIVIPVGRKGYWNSGRCEPDEKYGCICMGPDHGRVIPLADGAHIEAYTGYQMESEWSVNDYEKAGLSLLKNWQGVEQVKVLSSKGVWLDKVKARRYAVQYLEKDQNIIVERIIALHEGIEYDLILRTLAHRYQQDRREFEKVRASWRLNPRRE